MSLTLGEKFRQAREERGISVSEVAEQTRISSHYLTSIENDDYKTLPGGIFNKGFVKSYAKYVGLDENEVLQDYSRLVADAEDEDIEHAQAYRPEVLTDDRTAASMLPTIVFAGIILALMTGGILFVVNYLQSTDGESLAQATPTPGPANTSDIPVTSNLAQPTSDRITVQLKAVAEAVWTSYSVDGAAKTQTLAPDESVTLEAKDSFKLSYSKAKLPNLQIVLNGKQITPPNSDSKGTVEFEVNKENLAEIMQRSEAPPLTAPIAQQTPPEQTAATPEPTPREEKPSPVTKPSPTGTPRPRPPRPSPKPAFTPAPRPSGTPIVVGRPRTIGTP